MNIPKELVDQWAQGCTKVFEPDDPDYRHEEFDTHAFAQRAAEWALEEAARVCEHGVLGHGECADKIRALKGELK